MPKQMQAGICRAFQLFVLRQNYLTLEFITSELFDEGLGGATFFVSFYKAPNLHTGVRGARNDAIPLNAQG
jgi:hypothetical protein